MSNPGRLAVLCSALVLAATGAAAANAAPTAASDNDHEMGSQIALVEGRARPTAQPLSAQVAQTPGMDVSSHQGNIDWKAVAGKGGKFAYVKATEATTYTNPFFAQQYNGSYGAGLIHGAYHFAIPNQSGGTAQADYFVDHGGAWSRDGMTLPPALDIEYNPYGATCYGLSQAAMVAWVRDFSNRVLARTKRFPTIFTSTKWWSQCTGNNGGFGADNPLWVPFYGSSVGALPAGWGFLTIWQYADKGTFPGDQDRFNGAYDRLKALANG
jgi:GH25 family lysozyme M1 (1,4-beta-N-acetylmuramidase)